MPTGIYIRKKPVWNKGLKGYRNGHLVTEETREKIRIKKIGKKRPNISKENHYNWKGGIPKCVECSKQLASYKAKLCKGCSAKGERCFFYKGGKMKDYPELEQLRKSSESTLRRPPLPRLISAPLRASPSDRQSP